MDLAFAHHVADGQRGHHHLERHHTATPDPRQEALRQHALDDERELRSQLSRTAPKRVLGYSLETR